MGWERRWEIERREKKRNIALRRVLRRKRPGRLAKRRRERPVRLGESSLPIPICVLKGIVMLKIKIMMIEENLVEISKILEIENGLARKLRVLTMTAGERVLDQNRIWGVIDQGGRVVSYIPVATAFYQRMLTCIQTARKSYDSIVGGS